jgi:hypothetical protein
VSLVAPALSVLLWLLWFLLLGMRCVGVGSVRVRATYSPARYAGNGCHFLRDKRISIPLRRRFRFWLLCVLSVFTTDGAARISRGTPRSGCYRASPALERGGHGTGPNERRVLRGQAEARVLRGKCLILVRHVACAGAGPRSEFPEKHILKTASCC